MKALVQWSQSSPQGWHDVDPAGWRDLPAKAVPRGGEAITRTRGWVFDLCVQGWHLRGADHYAVEPVGEGLRVYRWFDDLEDVETDYRHGQVIEFHPGWVDRTVDLGDGTVRHQGPDQRLTEYAEDLDAHRPLAPRECGGLPVELKPWGEFPMPDESIVRHGIWLPDALMDAHVRTQRPVSWEEWTPRPVT